MTYHRQQKTRSSGFSVLEIAAVLVIGSAVIAAYAGLMNARMEASNMETTRHRLEAIDQALKKYWRLENHFPLPTHFETPLDTAHFGQEEPCTATDGIEVNGRAGKKVCIGSLPVRELSLPDDYVTDAWMGKFVYAVSKDLTSTSGYVSTEGAIDVIDGTTGLSVLESPGIAQYFVLSHGPNQKGAYTLSGTGAAALSACEPDASERENCDQSNAIFAVSSYAETAITSSSMDDMSVYWPRQIIGGESTPAYMVMAFNRTTCPRGWSSIIYSTDGTTKFRVNGRVIVGTGPYSEPATADQDFFAHTYTLREHGGLMRVRTTPENLPPHRHTYTLLVSNFASTGAPNFNVFVPTGTTGGPYATRIGITNGSVYEENSMPVMPFKYCMKQ